MNMSSDAVTRVSVEIAGSEISFETGRMAKQASGAVVVRMGDTIVLSTATAVQDCYSKNCHCLQNPLSQRRHN